MFLLARCQLPEPWAVQLARSQHRRRALAFRLGGRLCKAWPCHFSLRKSTPATQGAISWPLLVIKLIERGWHVWGPGMTGLCLWWREDFWLAVAMCVKWVLKFVCVCVFWVRVGVRVWVCVRDNPGESLSLKGNRCRFTYVEGPQPVMRLTGWDLSSQQLEGAYLINAWS